MLLQWNRVSQHNHGERRGVAKGGGSISIHILHAPFRKPPSIHYFDRKRSKALYVKQLIKIYSVLGAFTG